MPKLMITLLAVLCSLSFSILTVIAFSIGLDPLSVGLLGFMGVVSFGFALVTDDT